MKAIILAAGKGQRLKQYADGLPKGMLSFAGQPLIERQLQTLRGVGIDDITIIRGYEREKILFSGVKYYDNLNFNNTNMLASLMCGSPEFTDDVLVCYADILYEKRLIKQLVAETKNDDFVVLADVDWKNYWEMRYGTINYDIESFKLDEGLRITEIGQDCSNPAEIDARYIGLLKFSQKGILLAKCLYEDAIQNNGGNQWGNIPRSPQRAFMTDLFQILILHGESVKASLVKGGWIEFDTNKDYEFLSQLYNNGKLDRLIDLNK
ncbi:MAG: phosphocholine cytidylyltransferase family protein [Clostridiales bacterium]|nr:phosphocholine cytidylyltransferase family protein [Clostridiales bacterium]